MYCASCGGKNDDSVKFCAHCGAPVTPAATPRTPAASQPQSHAQHNGCGGCGCCCGHANAPYISDYLAGNIILSILCTCCLLPFFAWIGLGFSIASRSAKRAGAYDVAHSRAGVAKSLFWIQFIVGVLYIFASIAFCALGCFADIHKNAKYSCSSAQLTEEQLEELGEAFESMDDELANALRENSDDVRGVASIFKNSVDAIVNIIAPNDHPNGMYVEPEEALEVEASADEPAAEEAPADEPAAEETPADAPAVEEPAAADEVPADEPAVEEPAAADETPADEPAAEDGAAEEAPVEV